MSMKSKPMLKSAQSTVLCIPPALAAEIGLNNAMVLMQIAFWIRTSDNYRDGHWWTFQSTRGMQQKAFPFWSHMTVNRAINALLTQGLLIEGVYNTHGYDRTRWFALNEEAIARLHSVDIIAQSQPDTPVSDCDTVEQFDITETQIDTPPMEQAVTEVEQSGATSSQIVTTIPENPIEIKDKKIKDSFAPADAVRIAKTEDENPSNRVEVMQSHGNNSTTQSTIPHTDKIALIRAWWETLPAQPATVDNPYNRKPWHKQAETLMQAGLTAEDVRRFVSTKTASGHFYHDKHLPWARVASDLPAWVSQNPANQSISTPVNSVSRTQQIASDGERLATPAEIAAARKAFDQLVAQYRGIKS